LNIHIINQSMELPSCSKCFQFCLLTSHPLLPNPSWKDNFCRKFLCPPHGIVGTLLLHCLILLLFTGSAWAILAGNDIFKTIYSLVFLLVICHILGWLTSLLRFPPLLGMLVAGFCLKNIPGLKDVFGMDASWSSLIRTMALVVILARAGMGLDPAALKRLSFTVIRLAFTPCLVETGVIVLVTHFLLGFPIVWGSILGFVLAAVSPAVVVPSMIWCQEQRLGVSKGIPTLVIAAASVDDVLAITGFSVALGIAFDSGESLTFVVLRGPLEVLIGVTYGILTGCLAWYIPEKDSPNVIFQRFILLAFFGTFAAFVFEAVDFPGAGALGALTTAFVANLGWRKQGWQDDNNPVKGIFGSIWTYIAQPLLFGLIGAEIRASELDPSFVKVGLACLAISLAARVVVTFCAVLGAGMNWKELLFIPLAWLPKATVQAAIGAVALDRANEILAKSLNGDAGTVISFSNSTYSSNNFTLSEAELNVDRGLKVLQLAVLAILITAPIGAISITLAAPKLLEKDNKNEQRDNDQGGDDKSENTDATFLEMKV